MKYISYFNLYIMIINFHFSFSFSEHMTYAGRRSQYFHPLSHVIVGRTINL